MIIISFQPGCVNTTEMDIRKCRRMKNPQKVKKVSLSSWVFVLLVWGWFSSLGFFSFKSKSYLTPTVYETYSRRTKKLF